MFKASPSRKYCLPLLWAVLVAQLLCVPAVSASTSAVTVPIYLEYPLLRYLLVNQLFNTPDGSREILNDPKACNRIVLSDPDIAAQGQDLAILATVQAQLGVDVFGKCLDLINWDGGVTFLGRPEIQPDGKSIKLVPQKTWLVDEDGNKILSGRLLDAGNASLMSFFGGFILNLIPHIETLGALLPEVLPKRSTEQLQAAVNSLNLSKMKVDEHNLSLALNFEVETLPENAMADSAAELSPEELQQLEAQWQMMDALLVGAVKHYAAATQLQSLRSKLLDILIDSRYRLRDVLTEPASRNNDAVTSWFIDSWHSLVPVVRSIAEEHAGQEQLLWFSSVAAADALYALNELGSTIGVAISTDGLRRLARLISTGNVDEMLRYSEEVDPQLQELLREEIDAADPETSAFRLQFSLFSRVYAAAPGESLNQWLPAKGKLGDYLPKIEALLEKNGNKLLQQHKLERNQQQVFEKLLLATAWQESCWRQFITVEKRIEPLRSTSGDIGIMQVNERVWRGFYDLQKLRWDINYNITAGSEILLNYMVRYAIKRGEQKHPGGIHNLARASYSAYNGGPGQVTRYRSANVAATHKKVDKLFWEKYLQVDAGNAKNVARCLGEEPGEAA